MTIYKCVAWCLLIGFSGLFLEAKASSLETKEYIHVTKVDPEKVDEFKNQLKLDRVTFKPYEGDVKQGGESGVLTESDTFGMGEMKFSNPSSEELKKLDIPYFAISNGKYPILSTSGVRDCIAIASFDPETKKASLFHCSKMDIRPNDFNKKPIEESFIPWFKKVFSEGGPQTYLITSCYSQDLFDLIEIMDKNGISINGIDVPDIVLTPPKISEKKVETIVYTNEEMANEFPLLKEISALPSARVILDKKTGEIYVDRY
jgi:hypothetical protein